ncbi:MAG: bifunctional phosphoribosylaminoimidazolecarboxamide formyltransferase/IMP cyclohydrolase [Candidatus Dormibacteraeota bacterium]|nr:bifunctional phosphoribosylaminoimidazolecarboxamide formyltransferase/IMP cyclohydrolase [Candidatus Dormibacteraeota bacterium]
MPKRALLSVSNKASLPAFARGLVRLGFELYSTGGTLQALEEASIDVRPVTDLTEFPEILDGRVKTLHPGVHAGLLARRDVPEHMDALAEHGLQTIDLLCCNLYPFAETVAREHVTPEQVLEQIDVGGPAMVRAAAKNYASVIVVVRPERYAEVLSALGEGDLDELKRRRLAAEAFAHVAAYDSQIASWLRAGDDEFPTELPLAGVLAQGLRYGENPHQRAAFYRVGSDPGGIGSARQLQGLDLSYNNIQDAAAACALVCEYPAPAAAIIKHTNPCGLALAEKLSDAYLKAYECDPTSAYGGVVAFNRELDGETAKQMGPAFLEVVIAPSFTLAARELFERKQKTRVLEVGNFRWNGLKVQSVPGGFLAQTWDLRGFDPATSRVVSHREPTADEWEQLEFAWLAVKHVKSNAIVIARDHAAVGVGAGQMSRVEAAEIAMRRAGERARGGVMASDAFFPFADGVQVALRAGVTAVIQPGGSLRDREVVAAVDEMDAAMVMTGERHFLH